MRDKIIITPEQCKAARDLLKWSQKDLSEFSGVGTNTIATFEKGSRELRIGTLEKIIHIFQENSIRFENNEKEIVVRLLKNQ